MENKVSAEDFVIDKSKEKPVGERYSFDEVVELIKEYASQSSEQYSEAFWKELKNEFFKACNESRYGLTPEQVFEWFKSSLINKPQP